MRRRLCFIHIPRTGGHTVGRWLTDGVRSSLGVRVGHGHPRLRDFVCVLVPRENFLAFSVVRNPWAWHVSWYHAFRQLGNNMGMPQLIEIACTRSFSDYLRWVDGTVESTDPACYPRWQMRDWLADATGTVAVDEILRNETLLDDVNNLRQRLGQSRLTDASSCLRVSQTQHDDYHCYYDAEGRGIVARRHARDIEEFGYRFEGA